MAEAAYCYFGNYISPWKERANIIYLSSQQAPGQELHPLFVGLGKNTMVKLDINRLDWEQTQSPDHIY